MKGVEMRGFKRISSILISMIVVLTTVIMPVMGADAEKHSQTAFEVESLSARAGEDIAIKVTVKNNPGIIGATMEMTYDQGLSLTSAEAGNAFSALTLSKPGTLASPCRFVWDGQDVSDEEIQDGTILTLHFHVTEDAQTGDRYNIKIGFPTGDCYDRDLHTVTSSVENGFVNVINFVPGDASSDGKVNVTDIAVGRRFLAGGYNVKIDKNAANVNDDGKFNSIDIVLLRRFLAGGYNVSLVAPTTMICDHMLEAVEYKAASCTEDGNIAYWHCTECDKYFSDAEGNHEIDKSGIKIPAVGHTVVVDPAISPTETAEGKTEGTHCAVCKTVLVKQNSIPKITREQYPIEYHLFDGDPYLQEIGIYNPNQDYFTSEGLRLQPLTVEGYKFEGWYDGEGNTAEKVNVLDGTDPKGTVVLFAHWTKIEYEVQFDSPFSDIPSQKYTVDKGISLKNPSLNGYNFMGWSDESNKVVSSIEKGTVGNIKLKANWSSKRNQTKPVKKLEDPIIVEDTDQGNILFAYEIGTIENVPLYTIKALGNSTGGLVQVQHEEVTNSISESDAKTIAKSIANATTNSQTWTLSEDWNNITSVSETYLKQTGETRSEAETNAKTSSNTYSLNSSRGGTSTSVDSTGTSSKIGHTDTGGGSNSGTQSEAKGYEYGVAAKVSGEVTASSGIDTGIIKGESSVKIGAEISGNIGTSGNATNSRTGTSSWGSTDNEDKTTDVSHVSTSASSWNSSSGYSSSNSTSQSKTISNVLSSLIAETKGYGKTYAEGGSRSDSRAFIQASTETDQYSSTLTYCTAETVSKEKTYQMSGEIEGYYRIVEAGTVHVYAVVGYDVATKTYYTYTYNILDDATHEFVDYSRITPTFNDEENGVLPFEVPIFVKDYVDSKIAKSDDLVIDQTAGNIDSYNGSDTKVIIPSYIAVDNKDGTLSSVKVKGLANNVFTNNNKLVSVRLSDFISEIPEYEFSGCTLLEDFVAGEVTQISTGAFKNCFALKQFTVPKTVTSLGENAFEGVDEISVIASNLEVAQAALKSGAKRIVLDISEIEDYKAGTEFEVSSTCSYFELRGKNKNYPDLRINSKAKETVINGVIVTDCKGIPLRIESDSLVLNRVTLDSIGYAMMLSKKQTDILLQGTIDIVSKNGKAIVCRDVSLGQLDSTVAGKLAVSGNIYVCGKVDQNSSLSLTNGNIINISEEEFEKYLKGSFVITLDSNGGENISKSEFVGYCNSPVGTLPVAHRDYYTFEGWYTDTTAGDKVTEDTAFDSVSNITLYAHWKLNDTSDWVKASEVPADAQEVNSKWSYTLREYSTSSESSKPGWVLYDKKRTGWGPTQGPVYSDPSNGERNVWSEQYVVSSNYRTVWHYYRWTKSGQTGGTGSWAQNAGTHKETYTTYSEWTEPSGLANGAVKYWHGSNYTSVWKDNPYTTQEWVSDNYGTRWYYQDPIYTYYYYRDVNKEDVSDPSGKENVSNIQKWVQYRNK